MGLVQEIRPLALAEEHVGKRLLDRGLRRRMGDDGNRLGVGGARGGEGRQHGRQQDRD